MKIRSGCGVSHFASLSEHVKNRSLHVFSFSNTFQFSPDTFVHFRCELVGFHVS